MLKVAVLGGSGYTGCELLRLLSNHPQVEITVVTSERSAGSSVREIFPHLRNLDLVFEPLRLRRIVKKADLFFLCLPHRTSQEAVAFLNEAGKRVIDFSADYRLKNARVYEEWYSTTHEFPGLLRKAVYGLPELHRNRIRTASIVANPGCYPVSAILGLAPLMDKTFIDTDSIIIDSKSGVSGAGRSPAQPFMFSEVNESVRAYAITAHRHIPEIEQELSHLAKKGIRIIFTPHLIPMDRGILSTIYVRLKKDIGLSEVHKIYREFYRGEPFVRILGNGETPATKAVRGGNFCDISIFLDQRRSKAKTLVIVSAIDNLLKGASGQAVHNMNIMYGFDETAGLIAIPAYP